MSKYLFEDSITAETMAELAIGIAGLAGTIESCIKGGRYLVQAASDYENYNEKLHELSVRIRACWSRISAQLEIERQMGADMVSDQQDVQIQVLSVLESKLNEASKAMSKLDTYKKGGVVAMKLHFLSLRDALDAAVTDLEAWQKRFEPSWFQMIKPSASASASSSNIGIDKALRDSASDQDAVKEALRFRKAFESGESVFISKSALDNHDKLEIAYSTASVLVDQNQGRMHVIDTVSAKAVSLKDARELAHRLQDSDPVTFGMMRCKGIMRAERSNMGFIFRVPEGFTFIRSLRDLLLTTTPPASLSIRLDIARQLATAVYYVHLFEFVHKSISPENVLLLGKSDDDDENGRPLLALIGFQVLRSADGKTNTAGFGRKNSLYRHPLRLGPEKSIDFIMQLDMYSLGVCLLEIGLWQSLVIYTSDKHEPKTAGIHDLGQGSPAVDKEKLVMLCRGLLRQVMGDQYSRVVETCLTCLDENNLDFGDPTEFLDADGIEVGSMYVKKIIETMIGISI